MATTAAARRTADKAAFTAQGAAAWIKCRAKDGRPFAYGVPSASQPGLYHLVNLTRCDCPSFAHRGDCYHRQAVVLAVARIRTAQQPAAAVPARPVAQQHQADRVALYNRIHAEELVA
jgi:hypothetical protein